MDEKINDIISTIENAVNAFQKQVPNLQQNMFDQLRVMIKDLKLVNGNITANIENLKLIAQIRNKLDSVILNPDFKNEVRNFIEAYNQVQDLNNGYFAQFNAKFTAKKTFDIIKDLAVESTVNSLLGAGISSNVIDKVADILRTNIVSGGSYAALTETLRNHILTNNTGEGTLERYTKQITTDAINQYSANYHQAIASDLGFEWGRYIGSNITTTREFCEWLTKKEWVHISELPEILKGHIDNHECKINNSTNLPSGMIPGTNPSNFKTYRGGYNCGHQYMMVPNSAVPENIKNIYKTKQIEYPLKNNIQKYNEVKKGYSDFTIKELKDKFGYTPEIVDMLTGGLPVNDVSSIYHSISTHGTFIKSEMESEEFYIQRQIYPKDKKIYNANLRVNTKGEGLGLAFFTNQIVSAKNLGYETIEVSAASGGSYNGYYTWARFGYSMKESSQNQFNILMEKHGRSETNIHELMGTAKGVNFWKEKGFWFEGYFSLKEGSINLKSLQNYLDEKGIDYKL